MDDDIAGTLAVPRRDADEFIARYRAYQARALELIATNKIAVMAELTAAGIARVVVTFDGYSDSGQIEDITATDANDADCALPETDVALIIHEFGQADPSTVARSIPNAIEVVSYDCLEGTHDGWENNAGAFGTVELDVALGTISLEYNERYETSELYEHRF